MQPNKQAPATQYELKNKLQWYERLVHSSRHAFVCIRNELPFEQGIERLQYNFVSANAVFLHFRETQRNVIRSVRV